MTENFRFVQRSHLDAALTEPANRTLNAHKLVGRWINTDSETEGLAEITIEERDGEFTVSPIAVGDRGSIKWPSANARVLANLDEEGGQRAIALEADFDFGFMKSETCLRVNKGVLVIVLFNQFRDDSNRANYVTREFFSRQD